MPASLVDIKFELVPMLETLFEIICAFLLMLATLALIKAVLALVLAILAVKAAEIAPTELELLS